MPSSAGCFGLGDVLLAVPYQGRACRQRSKKEGTHKYVHVCMYGHHNIAGWASTSMVVNPLVIS